MTEVGLLYELDEKERRTLLRFLDTAWANTNDLREHVEPNSTAEASLLDHQRHLEAIMAKLR